MSAYLQSGRSMFVDSNASEGAFGYKKYRTQPLTGFPEVDGWKNRFESLRKGQELRAQRY